MTFPGPARRAAGAAAPRIQRPWPSTVAGAPGQGSTGAGATRGRGGDGRVTATEGREWIDDVVVGRSGVVSVVAVAPTGAERVDTSVRGWGREKMARATAPATRREATGTASSRHRDSTHPSPRR